MPRIREYTRLERPPSIYASDRFRMLSIRLTPQQYQSLVNAALKRGFGHRKLASYARSVLLAALAQDDSAILDHLVPVAYSDTIQDG